MEAESDSMMKSRDQLKLLKSSHNNSLALFGPQMKELVELVQKNMSRFEHPPIGPLGAMIKLHDYTWSTAVEQLVKSLLHAFVVDNHRDESVLRGLVQRVYRSGGRKPEVVKSTFQSTVYDVRRNVRFF
jgi:chromosome segregation ATPase